MTDENEDIETGSDPNPDEMTEDTAHVVDSSEDVREKATPPENELADPVESESSEESVPSEGEPVEEYAVSDEVSEPEASESTPHEAEIEKEIEPTEEPEEVAEDQSDEAQPAEEPIVELEPSEELVADATESISEPSPTPEEVEAPAEEVEPAETGEEDEIAEEQPEEPVEPDNKRWYVVKVQSGREETIKNAIERRVKIEGLEDYFGRVLIPTEKVPTVRKVTTKNKQGEKVTKEKRVTKEVKKFPGYLMVNVEFNDQILYLFRETAGVGDFVGGGLHRLPTPMPEREVQKMLGEQGEPTDDTEAGKKYEQPVFDFGVGDRVRVREGSFEDLEGEVKEIVPPKDDKDTTKIRVELTLWGRPMEVEIEPWNVESA